MDGVTGQGAVRRVGRRLAWVACFAVAAVLLGSFLHGVFDGFTHGPG